MTITITIDPVVESVGIQTIAVALGVSDVTDAEAKTHLANHLKTRVAELYVRGDQIIRQRNDDAAAVNAAATYITVG